MKAGAAWPRAGNKAFKGTLTSPLSPLLSSLTKWPRPPNVRLAEPKVVSPDCQLIARTRGERETGPVQQIEGGGLENIYNKKFFTNSNGHRWHEWHRKPGLGFNSECIAYI